MKQTPLNIKSVQKHPYGHVLLGTSVHTYRHTDILTEQVSLVQDFH